MLFSPKSLLTAAALCVAGLPAYAISVVNGGFEDPDTPNIFSAPSSGPLPGWSITNGNVEVIQTAWVASEGEQSLDLNGVLPGTITQSISGFSIGNDYELLFDMGGNFYGGSTTKFALVGIGPTSNLFSYVKNGSNSEFVWEEKSLLFTATAEIMTLSFSDQSNGAAAGAALDNIRINDLGGVAPVPLPAGGALLLTGLAALALRRRR